ncbi:hypothetical protein GCM10027419_06750 [Pandoraea terrae]
MINGCQQGLDIATRSLLRPHDPVAVDALRIATALAECGIAVSKAEAYATTRHAPHALRLGLSSVPMEQLRPVLMQVRETIEQFPI